MMPRRDVDRLVGWLSWLVTHLTHLLSTELSSQAERRTGWWGGSQGVVIDPWGFINHCLPPPHLSEKSPGATGLKCCCQVCCGSLFLDSPSEYLEIVRENHGLLPPLYKPVKTYNV